MAAKDADLASDYASRQLVLSDDDTAQLEVSKDTMPYPGQYPDLYLSDFIAPKTYLMHGFDTNGAVNDWVFWEAAEIDDDASEYTGSAGPVTNISLHSRIPE